MSEFRRLRVWRAAHRLTLFVYRSTEGFPRTERYGITSQLRRAASSIGANIAEGCGRGSDRDSRRCYHIAFGSACELLNHTLLARDLGLLDAETFTALESAAEPVRKMLYRLIERSQKEASG